MFDFLSRPPSGRLVWAGLALSILAAVVTIATWLVTAGPIWGGLSLFAFLLAVLWLLVPWAARGLYFVRQRLRFRWPFRWLPSSSDIAEKTSAPMAEEPDDPSSRPMSAEEKDIARLYNTHAARMMQNFGSLVGQISDAMRRDPSFGRLEQVAEQAMNDHHNVAREKMQAWGEAVESRVPLHTLQRVAGDAYRDYQRSVQKTRDVVLAAAVDVRRDATNFSKWTDFDTAYLAGLNELCGDPDLKALSDLVTHHMWPDLGKRNYSEWQAVTPDDPSGGSVDPAEVIDALIDYKEALLEMINRVMLLDDVKVGLITMPVKRTTQLDQLQRKSRERVLARENVLRRMAAQANPATSVGAAINSAVAALGNLKAASHWRDPRENEAIAKVHKSIDGAVSAIHAARAK